MTARRAEPLPYRRKRDATREADALVSDLTDLPLLLTIHELAAVYRCGTSTIYRQLLKGVFRPLPTRVAPYRWRRADVEHDLLQPRPTPRRRRRARR